MLDQWMLAVSASPAAPTSLCSEDFMKKAIALVVALGVGGAGVAAYAYLKNPERAACIRVADLCGQKDGGVKELDQCVEQVTEWRKVAGDDAVNKGMQCVDDA